MLLYILKSTFCLVLLLGFYHLILEKEKMHRFNRFFLLGSILFSFMVPSFIITVAPTEFVEPILTEQVFIVENPTVTPIITSQEFDYTNYFIIIYALISAVFFYFFARKIHLLLLKTKRNKKVSYFKATVVLLKEQVLPHTFLNYIFINKKEFKSDCLEQQILTHELTHVEQKHTLDVLFIELLMTLFWFNPIFRYYKKAIQLNHEFLADDAVIKSHKNITEYQLLLVHKSTQQNNSYLASNFNYSLTKKRLLMMTTPSSKTNILFKKLMVFPLVAGFMFAFAQRVEAQENGITKELMHEYKTLFNSAKDSKIYKVKDVDTMMSLYKQMSKNQQESITDIRKVIPPPPPPTKKVQENKNNIRIAVNKKGELLVNKKSTSIDKLSDFLDEIIVDKNKAHIIITSDIESNDKDLLKIKKIILENRIYKITVNNKLLPPPPPIDLVYTYKRLAEKIQKTVIKREENVLYLKELYDKMSAVQKKQVTKPSKVLPPPPPKKQ